MVQLSLLPVLALPLGGLTYDKGWTRGEYPTGPYDQNVIGTCSYWVNDVQGDVCDEIKISFGITQEQFTTWNPSLKDDCSGFKSGDSYCVRVSPPPMASIQPIGMETHVTRPSKAPSSPSKRYLSSELRDCEISHIVKEGDTCDTISKAYLAASAVGPAWITPNLGNNCEHIKPGTEICIYDADNKLAERDGLFKRLKQENNIECRTYSRSWGGSNVNVVICEGP